MSERKYVKGVRKRLELSQVQLAQKLGVSVRTIIRYENGAPVPRRSMLALESLDHRRRRSA